MGTGFSVDRLPFVSVVIPAGDQPSETQACLASLAGLDYPASCHEIIVVTDDSDGLADDVRQYPFRCASESRRGVAYARNTGINASRGEIVAFTDTDCSVSTDWLRQLVKPFSDSAIGCVGGAIVPYPPETSAQRYAARRMSHSQVRPMSHATRPFAMTPNAAFRRDPLVRVGGFDTQFPGGGWEDADLCWRLMRGASLELQYAPRAVVFHRYRATARAFLVQHYRYGYGMGLLRRKYRGELGGEPRCDPRALTQLAASACECSRAAVLRVTSEHGDDLERSWFDLLRSVGQGSGLVAASLTSKRKPSRTLT